MFDGKAFGEDMVSIVRGFVERSLEPLAKANETLAERNAALEARVAVLEAREPFDPAPLQEGIERIARAVDALPPPPDVSGLASKEDVEAVRAAIPATPEPADLSGFATKAEVEDVRASIPALPEPVDVSVFVTTAAVDEAVAKVLAEISVPVDVGDFATREDVAAVLVSIPDVSGLATKEEIAEAVASIRLPEAIKGEDADPEVVAAIVTERIETRLAEADRRIDARLAEVKDGDPGRDGAPGKDGLLPLAEAWSDRVHYRSTVVTHGGQLWQATADTGREPPHSDWLCLAAKGADGITPEFVGTYEADGDFRRLDVVALNGGSFVALRDNPGPCPGDGWQLVAGRGKPGQAIKGDPGDKGDPGRDAEEIVGVYRNGDEIVITTGDGREFRA